MLTRVTKPRAQIPPPTQTVCFSCGFGLVQTHNVVRVHTRSRETSVALKQLANTSVSPAASVMQPKRKRTCGRFLLDLLQRVFSREKK